MRLFLDCEWADTEGTQLVSLALVSQDGQHRFYAEVDPLPQAPTDFVQTIVYPLLDRDEHAMSKTTLAQRLSEFLSQFEAPMVLYDYHLDGRLFRKALDAEIGSQDFSAQLIVNDNVIRLIEQYFQTHPEAASRRHHAAVDADALRWAFLIALRMRKPERFGKIPR